jgi:CubicO group peptidase (beta-lactamase class C family)
MSVTLAKSFALADSWGAEKLAVGVIDQTGALHVHGDTTHRFRLMSLSKLMLAWATLIAVEDSSISLDDAVGQEGCTVRHLLSHAGGYGFDQTVPNIGPGRRRIYCRRTSYELVAEYVAVKVDMDFGAYLNEAVFEPLGMSSTESRGSPAARIFSTISDLALFAAELRTPKLLARSTYIEATSPQFPHLKGRSPSVGSFDPCHWGLGPEILGVKSPHWMATRNSAVTFGHLGGTKHFIWIDPVANVACFALTEQNLGPEQLKMWPKFGDEVLNELGC